MSRQDNPPPRSLEPCDVQQLQQRIAMADSLAEAMSRGHSPGFIEALVFQLPPISVYIYPNEGHHRLPHFHVRIKGGQQASYSIGEFKRLTPHALDRRY